MITDETVQVTTTEAGFVHVLHRQMHDSGIDMGGHLWFDRDNLGWVIATLRQCVSAYGFPGAQEQRGADSLKIFESGPEQAPIINIQNRRAKDQAHGGVYALLFSKPKAEAELLKELEQLRDAEAT